MGENFLLIVSFAYLQFLQFQSLLEYCYDRMTYWIIHCGCKWMMGFMAIIWLILHCHLCL